MSFTESKTHQNLKAAFAGESQANRRYTWMAQVAEKEGLPRQVATALKGRIEGLNHGEPQTCLAMSASGAARLPDWSLVRASWKRPA